MKQSIFTTIYAILFIVFALLWNKERWKRIYSENRLDYCRELITVYKMQNSNVIERAENMWYYGCTRQK